MSAGDWKEMYSASVSGDLELVQYHIRNGVDPNYQHPEIMSTALVASIIGNHPDISLFLLEHGADPALRSEFDNLTPLQAARMFRRHELVAILEKMVPKKSLWQKLENFFKN
ncbi:ankyrin repeat domain-containing protein [Bdellovibrio sp. SKB1291214]|uniref:ankyrin repeat domain-containing protein n=1 Tax=Bdellovibrio sp. SKB1291214 TaxID=1732569 RepID=UPI000B5177B4|nr:ankyrin repeat domain-containing protein [Bdellovibrio sp. SKB1291214]UYL09772.1 ankyrin repeat domain-containing protein [Bdellovibrio sp. SKB1291214]